MIIWKDVPGVLNADPRYFDDTVKIDKMTYRDAIELAYYGASVIHPKTIQPLQSSMIPMYVRSFYQPEQPGTLISALEEDQPDHIPSFIFKRDQVLISVSPRDFSFIAEDNLQSIFGMLYSLGIHFNMMQHSAISFSIIIDDHAEKMHRLFEALGKDYRVRYNTGLELITIRYYDQPTIDKVIAGRKILLEQKSRTTVQLVVSN
jgi:aspartate kinase